MIQIDGESYLFVRFQKEKEPGETVPVPALLASRCIEQLLKPRGAFKRRVHRLLSVLMLVRLKALALLAFHTPQ